MFSESYATKIQKHCTSCILAHTYKNHLTWHVLINIFRDQTLMRAVPIGDAMISFYPHCTKSTLVQCIHTVIF